MTSKDTRSDATGRQMLHHPVQTLKDHLTIHHDHKRERSEDKENAGRAVHFSHQDAHGHDNDDHYDNHHEHENDQTSAASTGHGKDSSADHNDAAGSHPSQHHVSDPDHSRAEDVARDFLGRSEEHRTVRDPITHTLLRNVRDVTNEEYQGGLSEAARVKQVLKHPDGENEDNPASERWAGTSALPAFPYKHGLAAAPGTPAIIQRLENCIGYILYSLVLCWVAILAIHVDLPKTSLFAMVAIVSVPFARHLIVRRLQDALSDFDAVCEQDRGEQIGRTHWPESAEWANKVLSEIWPAIQPEMFDSLRDTLEDLLQANVPSFLSEVKVADFTQGANPLRILSVSLLPDTEWKVEKDGARDSKADGGEDHPLKSEVRRADQEAQKESNPEEEMTQEEHDPNDRYVNLSVTFAYRGKRKKPSRKEKSFQMAEDIQMLLLLVAKFGPAALMLPVKVHLQGLVGTVRIRTHLIASPPFLGQTLLSFTSLPRVQLDVVPLKTISLNDIKPLANFVQRSIDSAFAAITAPKSISIDLASLISSDGIQREIGAVGIVVITLLKVEGLERADIFGLSDPYALFLWTRSGKPMFSTRVILKELNPRFHESMAILVPQEIVKAKESIGVEVYDSDRGTDDFLGKTGLELGELMSRPGEEIKQTEQLAGVKPGSSRPGKITWSACFLPRTGLAKPDPEPAPEDSSETSAKASSSDANKSKSKQKSSPAYLKPPSTYLPSGILSLQIHEIAALSNQSSLNAPSSTSRFSRNTAEGRSLPDEDTTDDLADEAPNSYVEVIAEDKLVFRTRTKISDYRPIFNATTEKVILDWRTARVLLVIREKKFDEDDPILGIVPLVLSKVFEKESLSSGWHPIAGGIGSGRIKISLLFQAVELPRTTKDPPVSESASPTHQAPISPSSVGVIQLKRLKLTAPSDQSLLQKWSKHSMTIRTLSTRSRISSKWSQLVENGEDSQDGDSSAAALVYDEQLLKKPALIPTFRRGASPLMLRLDTKDSLGRTKIDAMAVFWLRNLKENQDTKLTLPIWKMHDKQAVQWLRQQYADHHTFEGQQQGGAEGVPETLNATVIGKAELEVCFVPGVNSLHGRIQDPSGGLPTVCQAWKLAVRKGLVKESWPGQSDNASQDGSGGPDRGGGGLLEDEDFYDANSSSSSSEGEDDEEDGRGGPASTRRPHSRSRSQREAAAQGKSRSVRGIATSSLDRVLSNASHRDGVSSGSKADLVRRFGRDLSDRQPIPSHYLSDSNNAHEQEAASGDAKPVRVLGSAVGAVKERGSKLLNNFDRKKGQKGGEGVEVEV